jgi:hypothetical protein
MFSDWTVAIWKDFSGKNMIPMHVCLYDVYVQNTNHILAVHLPVYVHKQMYLDILIIFVHTHTHTYIYILCLLGFFLLYVEKARES